MRKEREKEKNRYSKRQKKTEILASFTKTYNSALGRVVEENIRQNEDILIGWKENEKENQKKENSRNSKSSRKNKNNNKNKELIKKSNP